MDCRIDVDAIVAVLDRLVAERLRRLSRTMLASGPGGGAELLAVGC